MIKRSVPLILAMLLIAVLVPLQAPAPALAQAASRTTWYLTDYLSRLSGADYTMYPGSGSGETNKLSISRSTSKVWSADEASNIACRASGTWSVTLRVKSKTGHYYVSETYNEDGSVESMESSEELSEYSSKDGGDYSSEYNRWQSSLTVDIGVLSDGVFVSKGTSASQKVSPGWRTLNFEVTTIGLTINPGEYLAVRINNTGFCTIQLDVKGSSHSSSPCFVSSPSGADDYPGIETVSLTVIDYDSNDYPADDPDGLLFGDLDPGLEGPEGAQGKTQGAVQIVVGSETNVDCNIQIRGDSFTYLSNTIDISYAKWGTDASVGGATAMKADYVTITTSTAHEEKRQDVWHWLSIPDSQTAGDYTSIFYYRAVKQ